MANNKDYQEPSRFLVTQQEIFRLLENVLYEANDLATTDGKSRALHPFAVKSLAASAAREFSQRYTVRYVGINKDGETNEN